MYNIHNYSMYIIRNKPIIKIKRLDLCF